MPQISRTKRPRENNYFCGVLTCGCCGSNFTTHNYTNKAGENKCTYKCSKKTYYKGNDCDSPQITHDKLEAAFIEYIKGINNFTDDEIRNLDIDNDTAKKERVLREYIASCEQKVDNLQARKKRVSEQYFGEEITFEEYKNLLNVFNEKYEALEQELERAKSDLPKIKESPELSHEDIIADLKENWECLNNNEKMMFLQRFVKRLVIKVEKENATSNTVKIERVEFNSVHEPLEKGKKESIKGALINRSR